MSEQDSMLNELKALAKSRVSRRSVLAGAGAVGAGSLLAACGGGGGSDADVRWGNWTLYLDYDSDAKVYPTLEDFISETGINVKYLEDYNDNDEFYGKVQGQLKLNKDIGYDLICPTDWMAARYIRLGYAQKLDKANIPNSKNIIDSLASVPYDTGRDYSLTWQGIMGGFTWNKEKIPNGVRTLDDLFAPANKGKIEVLSELRDTVGVIMMAQGVDISKFTADQYYNAIDFLEKKISDGFIRQVKGNDYKEDLISGDCVAVIGWSGDAFQLAAENDGKFDFAIPESGGTISADNFIIPSTAQNKDKVEQLINYYYDPVVAAKVAAYVNYITPVKGAQEAMADVDPSLVDNELIFPSAATQSKLQVFRALTPAEETEFTDAFQKAAGN
ncbi:MAG: spermidine/putrescine ABC transporter substrate-binding protein [Candidatus Nanopelagicaceae bacterium]|nr:spermidine/putrescine ABC transporter substrate-binding protein [Candidatus Nanopelagicaceae bacterium]